MLNYFFNTDTSQNTIIYTNPNRWDVWYKPKGIKMVQMLCISGGSGGAGGTSGALGTNRNGGGGGASGNIAQLLIPSIFVPDRLYVYVGGGGNGGNPNSNASTGIGQLSRVSIQPSFATNQSNFIQANNSIPGGGTIPFGGGTGALGSNVTTVLGTLGIQSFLAGGNGVSGAVSSGNSITLTQIVSGGAGGGGFSSTNVESVGGNIIGNGSIPTIFGGSVGGGNGENGYDVLSKSITSTSSQLYTPSTLFFTGGAGGGSNTTGTGGNGGNGGIGCGGGGGGAGLTGGRGGNGGSGLVMIISW
jgi:hypothetical protein